MDFYVKNKIYVIFRNSVRDLNLGKTVRISKVSLCVLYAYIVVEHEKNIS
jgi:hypothetical protein